MSQSQTRQLPHNIEAEEAVLGGILLDPNAFSRIPDELRPESFFIIAHQQIFEAALFLYVQGKPTDFMGVSSYLSDHHLLDRVGGTGRLAKLLNRTVSAVNIDRYCNIVIDKYAKRRLINAGILIVEIGYDSTKEPDVALGESESYLFEISNTRPSSGMVSLENSLDVVFDDIEEVMFSQKVPGLMTGFYDLDELTQGISKSDLVILAGRPSMGKTALCLGMALNIAQQGLPVPIFSLEMSRKQLTNRLLSIKSGIDSQRIRTGNLSQLDLEQLRDARTFLAELPIFIDDQVNITIPQMRSRLTQLESRLKRPIGLTIVDYLQLMGGSIDNRVQEVSYLSRSLKCLARDLDCPILSLSQLSREVEKRTNKRPMLSDLRESGSIEQDADMVIMIYRDDYYNPDSPFKGTTELILAKNRNGGVGTVKLRFIPQQTKFVSLQTYG